MASIRKRGSSYLIVVSMGYDYNGKRIKPQQKTVHPPEELTPRQVEKWLNEQAVLFERECRHTPQPVQQLTLAKYIDLWLTDIAPGKLAKSTIRRDRQDIERILPALGHYKLTELRPEHFRNFYAELRKVIRPDTKKPLSEYTIEGVHATLCSILSDAVEGGFLFRIIRLGAPTATPGASAKRRSRTRKRRRRSSPRWRARASSTKPTSSSSSPRECGGASAAD